jgi:hypothetical protein
VPHTAAPQEAATHTQTFFPIRSKNSSNSRNSN